MKTELPSATTIAHSLGKVLEQAGKYNADLIAAVHTVMKPYQFALTDVSGGLAKLDLSLGHTAGGPYVQIVMVLQQTNNMTVLGTVKSEDVSFEDPKRVAHEVVENVLSYNFSNRISPLAMSLAFFMEDKKKVKLALPGE